jgi:hypothetical protein
MSTEKPQFDQHNWGGGHVVKKVAVCKINQMSKNFISFFLGGGGGFNFCLTYVNYSNRSFPLARRFAQNLIFRD